MIKTLERAGWRHARTSGDHRVFRNADGRITVVSGKLGDDVRLGTYRAILRQTGIKDEPFMTRRYSLVIEGDEIRL